MSTFEELTNKVQELLSDTDGVNWTDEDVRGWLVESQLAVVVVRPDAHKETSIISLEAGTRQTLPPSGLRLIDVLCNTGTDAQNPVDGRVVTRTNRDALDKVDALWRSGDPQEVVRQVVYDELDEKQFDVWPPNDGTGTVRAIYSAVPEQSPEAEDDVDLAANYEPAMIEWTLYRCYGRSSDKSPDHVRGQTHLNQFLTMLGIKTQGDRNVSYKRLEKLQ